MSRVTVSIATRHLENYNTSGEGAPHWKAKGFIIFEVKADSDMMFYSEPQVIEAAIQEMLAPHNDAMNCIEYDSHKIKHTEPTKLNASVFANTVRKHNKLEADKLEAENVRSI